MGQNNSQLQVSGLRLNPSKSSVGVLDKCVILKEGTPTLLILYKNGISYVQRHGTWQQGVEELDQYIKDGYVQMTKKDLNLTLKRGIKV